MKEKIKEILKNAGKNQVNLDSDPAVEKLADEIVAAVKQYEILRFGPHIYPPGGDE